MEEIKKHITASAIMQIYLKIAIQGFTDLHSDLKNLNLANGEFNMAVEVYKN